MIRITGHRGAAGVVPENTLKGFRYAIELGVDAVECDVHLTRDGQAVVMHDEGPDRAGHAGARWPAKGRPGRAIPLRDAVDRHPSGCCEVAAGKESRAAAVVVDGKRNRVVVGTVA